MIRILIIILLLIAAIWLGWQMHQEPGAVMVTFHQWQLETSVWMALMMILLTFIVAYVLVRIIIHTAYWPRRWRQWRQTSRQQDSEYLTELAACESIEENWAAAENHFQQAAAASKRPFIDYLGAAIAAQKQSASDRRERYLRQAFQAVPNAELTLGILRTKLQIQAGELTEASATLQKLQTAIPNHPVVKKLLQILQNLNPPTLVK